MNNTELRAGGGHVGRNISASGDVENDTTEKRCRWPWRWLHRRPGQWVVPCRDEARRRRQLLVAPTGDGRVALVVPSGGVTVLDLLAVGAPRSALREAVFAVADPGTEHLRTFAVSTTVQRGA